MKSHTLVFMNGVQKEVWADEMEEVTDARHSINYVFWFGSDLVARVEPSELAGIFTPKGVKLRKK